MLTLQTLGHLCFLAWVVLQVVSVREFPNPRPAIAPGRGWIWANRHPFQFAFVFPLLLVAAVLLPILLMMYEVATDTSAVSTIVFSAVTALVATITLLHLWSERDTGRPRRYFYLQECRATPVVHEHDSALDSRLECCVAQLHAAAAGGRTAPRGLRPHPRRPPLSVGVSHTEIVRWHQAWSEVIMSPSSNGRSHEGRTVRS